MTTPEGGLAAVGHTRTGRRRLLAGLGASALVTSVAIFGGKAKEASAAGSGPACCNLAHYPANTTYSNCHANAAYIWYCTDTGGFLHCACCETSGNALSAADCRYG
ncbi:hypothetical protein [Dactylosporangium sp. NPDC051484]|uniref:hypothetical protein n=1 Tax=Dactylosporangium sp. NPDC051484 TaxID=3154942 RepID=UPI00344C2420